MRFLSDRRTRRPLRALLHPRPTVRARSGPACAALAIAVLSFSACSPGLGELCFKDSDCKAGLRCTARGDGRGVCTYPAGIDDASTTRPDRGQDAATDMDATPDLWGELGPDLPGDLAPDQTPDQQAPDQGQPDQTADQTQPDQAVPDAAKADS